MYGSRCIEKLGHLKMDFIDPENEKGTYSLYGDDGCGVYMVRDNSGSWPYQPRSGQGEQSELA